MATDEERLLVHLEAKVTQFEKAMKQASASSQNAASKIRNDFSSIERQAAAVGRNIGRIFGVSLGVAGLHQLTSAIREAVNEAGTLVDLADKIGITTDALQELRFQAEQNGASTGELDNMLEQFSRRIGLAATGTGELLKILEANGVALRDNAGVVRPLTDLLADYAELIRNAANDQDRAVISTEAFGRAGDVAANIFRDGAPGIKEFADRAHELGQVVSEEGVRSLEAFEDRLLVLQGRWDSAMKNMSAGILEFLYQIGRAEHAIVAFLKGDLAEFKALDAARQLRELMGSQPGTTTPTARRGPATVLPSRASTNRSGEAEMQRAQRAHLQSLENDLQKTQDRMQALGDVGRDVFSSLVSDFRSGATAAQALSNSLAGLLDNLANLAINSIFSQLLGGGLSPGAGALGRSGFGGLFAEGGNLGAGKWGIAGEHGPEIIRGPASVAPLRNTEAAAMRVFNSIEVKPSPLFLTSVEQKTERAAAGAVQRMQDQQRRFA